MTRLTFRDGNFWADKELHGFAKHPNGAWFTDDPVYALPHGASGDQAAQSKLADMETMRMLSSQMEYLFEGQLRMPPGKELRPHQRVSVEILRHTPQAYLADIVGSGKTVVCCVALMNLTTEAECVLVICPTNVLFVWERHLREWCGIEADVITTVAGAKAARLGPGATVTTFDLARELPEIAHLLDLMIVDESAKIKNPKAARTIKILGEIAPCTKRVWHLSGTPVPNGRPVELWPILASAGPPGFKGQLKYLDYTRKYCGAYMDDGRLNVNGATNLDELHYRLRCQFMIRRDPAAIKAALPPLVSTVVPIEGTRAMAEEQAPFIRRYVSNGYTLAGMDLGDIARLRNALGERKLKAAVSMAQDLMANGESVILFCHHVNMVRELARQLECQYIDGSVSPAKRAGIVDRYQAADFPAAIVLNSAGKEGITLTKGSNVILVEASWTPGDNEQMIGRAHRIGQEAESVNAYYLVIRESLDEYVLSRNLDKQSNIDQMIDGKTY